VDNTDKFRALYQHLRAVAVCDTMNGDLRKSSLDFADDIFRIFPEVLDEPEKEDFHGLQFSDDKVFINGVEYNNTHTHIDAWNELKKFVLDGKKIQSIKRIREMTGMGLKESKNIVDDLFGRMGL